MQRTPCLAKAGRGGHPLDLVPCKVVVDQCPHGGDRVATYKEAGETQWGGLVGYTKTAEHQHAHQAAGGKNEDDRAVAIECKTQPLVG